MGEGNSPEQERTNQERGMVRGPRREGEERKKGKRRRQG